MRKLKKIKVDHNGEFELDLAPLLAVMVKLVPVLLVSSAFVQLAVIESELPQVVSEAIQREEQKTTPTNISIEMHAESGFNIVVTKNGKDEILKVPLQDGSFDYAAFHNKLVEVKKANPEVFKIEMNPDGKVSYDEIVKAMDNARQSFDNKTTFPVFDTKQGKNVNTHYMFPEVIFANMMEG